MPLATVNFLNRDVDDLTYNVWLNGKMIAENLTPDEGTTEWTDLLTESHGQLCYAVEAKYKSSGNYSHHSEPACLPDKSERFIPVTDSTVVRPMTANCAMRLRQNIPALGITPIILSLLACRIKANASSRSRILRSSATISQKEITITVRRYRH
ncbi:hypothetical protein [Klebsiella quasipneumoniae]|uniref:hypothetical protein n=1 Tax=Klebsiella quasipneumoniae TaxID=1463165 RepID=UPI0023E2AFC3|nr:hypothetical protein [Klebsiella quasipneumoniae]